MEIKNTTIPYKELKFRFPIDFDTKSLVAFVRAMGWNQYVVEDTSSNVKEQESFFSEFKNLPPDETPYKTVREEMLKEKYGF